MGLLRSSPFSSMAVLVFVLGLVLNVVVKCNGGITSTFVRKVEKTVDMPLDSDVFRVPPGYNAPQQVYFLPSLPLKSSEFIWFSLFSFYLQFNNFHLASFMILLFFFVNGWDSKF